MAQQVSDKSELVHNLEDLLAGHLLNGPKACTCNTYEENLKVAEEMVEQLLRYYDVKTKGSQ